MKRSGKDRKVAQSRDEKQNIEKKMMVLQKIKTVS